MEEDFLGNEEYTEPNLPPIAEMEEDFLGNEEEFELVPNPQMEEMNTKIRRKNKNIQKQNRELIPHFQKEDVNVMCRREEEEFELVPNPQMEEMNTKIRRKESRESRECCIPSGEETYSILQVLPELSTKMTSPSFTKEQVNYFKFAHIVVNEFPKALRHSFKSLWDTTYGRRPGYRFWDDSEEVRKMFLLEEGGTLKVHSGLSYTEWDFSDLFRATIFCQSLFKEDSTGRKTAQSDSTDRLLVGENPFSSILKSSTNADESFTIAINQLRLLRKKLLSLPKAEIDTKTFGSYIKLSKAAFDILNVATTSIRAISSYSDDDFPTERARKIKEDMRAELKLLKEKVLGSIEKLMDMGDLQDRRMEEIERSLERMMATLEEREKVPHELVELIKSGASPSDTGDFEPVSEKISVTENEKRWLVIGIAFQKILFPQIRLYVEQRMLQIYGQKSYVEAGKERAEHHYENVKSFDEFDLLAILCEIPSHCPSARDVRDVRSSWVDIDSNKWDQSKLNESFRAMEKLVIEMCLPEEDQQELLENLKYLGEKGERLFSDYAAKTSLKYLIKQLRNDLNDKWESVRASLVSIVSVLEDKKKPDQQLIEGETILTEDTASGRLATSPSTINKGKDSTSLEEVISVPLDKQQTEEQSGEDESEPFKETHSVGPETSLSHSKIGEVKDPTSLEEVTSVPNDKQQTEEQSGEDESESFEETLGENQAISPSAIDKGKDSTSLEEVISVPVDKQQTEGQSGEDESESFKETLSMGSVLPELNTNMTLEPFTKEQVNYFKFANIVVNEFPKALRQSFEHLWNTTYGQKPGYRIWDDSEEVRKMFLHEEGGTTDVPTDLSYTEWDCSNLFRATIFSQSFSEEDSTGWKTSLSEKYIKSRPDRLAEDELLTSGKSGTSVTKPFSIAINQLRTLRNTLLHLPKAEIDTKEFETYIQLSEEAFGILNVATASIRDISSYSEDDFSTKRARKIKEDIMNDMRAELKFLAEEELGRSGKLMKIWNLQLGRMERTEGLLKRMLATLKERKEGLYQLLELIESGLRLLSDYAVQPSLRYQVKQLRDDVNAKLEKVRPSLVSVASVLEDKKKLDQQPIEGGTKLPEDASSESLETSLFRLRIDEVKDSTSLEKVTSVLKDKQQTEKQSEDESESFEETLSGNQATSPSTIDKGKDSTLHEEVISVPLDKQQTEKQSGEDESESFKETLSVGPGAQDHDIKGKTTTFEAEHKECIRVLPYTNASGRVYVQLYVFCDKNGIPKELKADAQEFFGETGVELRWTNLYNYASNIPNIVSVDFKQLEVSQVNDVSKIINKNLHVFSKHHNITAIQPSLKETNSKQTNDPCIRVYVLGKGRVPLGESEIPNSVEDCPVDIVDGFWCETLGTLKPLTAHRQEKYLRLGASIGATNFSGTLGAILKDNDDGLYLLSCDHVIKHEVGGKVTHPGSHHYSNSIDYHMTDYRSWIDRIFEPIIGFHPQLGNDFMQLRGAVNSACNYLGLLLHPKLIECENIILKLLSEPPRTVAEYVGGIREDVEFLGKPFYLDVAIAKLTKEEEEALKKNGFVEIVDTTNYPDGNVTMGESQSKWREWFKSGSYTGCTSLKSSFFHGKVFLMNSEHERPSLLSRSFVIPREKADDDLWRRDCILFPHNENLFSYFGDSGAVIFEKSEQHPQAMPGFCIVIGGLFSNNRCVATIAVPLGVALEKLSEGLGSRLTLVSKLKTPSGHIYGF